MPRSRPVLACLALAIVCLTSCTRGQSETGGQLHLRFVVPLDLPLEVSVHQRPSASDSSSTRTYGKDETPDLGPEIAGGNLDVEFDVPQQLLLVVRNALDRPVRFWSAPHLPTPHSAEPALAIVCFCTGDTYDIPAGGTWTRPIEVGIRRRQAVDNLVVTHVITEGPAPALPRQGPR